MAAPMRLAYGLLTALVLTSSAGAESMLTYGNETPAVLWARAVGNGDVAEDEIDGVSVDTNGNTIITGVFRGEVTFDTQRFDSRGAGDIFLASIDRSGSLNWARRFGGSGDDNAFDLTTDSAGNIYISGWFSGAVDFGGTTLQSVGILDQVLAKYSPSGNLIWARRFGGPGGDGGNELAVLPNGDLVVSATSSGDFEADGQTVPFGGGRRDSHVLRFDPDGNLLWRVSADGSGLERIRAIAMNPDGEVYVGFQYRGILEMGGHQLQARGDWDGALARILPDGRVAWVLPVAGNAVDNVRAVAAAPGSDIYASGIVSPGARLFDQDLPQFGGRAIDYIARVSPQGQIRWLVTLVGSGRAVGGEIVADDRGVILSGMGDGPQTIRRMRDVVGEVPTPEGKASPYLAAFTADGQPRFVYVPGLDGRTSAGFGSALSVSLDGSLVAQALRFRGSVEVGGQSFETPSDKDSALFLLDLDAR